MNKDEIIEFIKENSYLTFDGCDDDNYLSFSTRKNGSVYDEEHSPIDYREALKVTKMLKDKYENIRTDIDTFDEWILFTVYL